MHCERCRRCGPLGTCRLPDTEIHRVQPEGETTKLHLRTGWVGHFISTVLNLPILFSDAREFTLGAGASFGRGSAVYLFAAIFILALACPLLIGKAAVKAANVCNGST